MLSRGGRCCPGDSVVRGGNRYCPGGGGAGLVKVGRCCLGGGRVLSRGGGCPPPPCDHVTYTMMHLVSHLHPELNRQMPVKT